MKRDVVITTVKAYNKFINSETQMEIYNKQDKVKLANIQVDTISETIDK